MDFELKKYFKILVLQSWRIVLTRENDEWNASFQTDAAALSHIGFRGTPYQSVPIRTISSREPADFSQRPDFKYGFVRRKTEDP